jgi:acyl-coenzyme A synthetase/AMP-(fatty) acid ligase
MGVISMAETATKPEMNARAEDLFHSLLESSTAVIVRDESQISAEELVQRAIALSDQLRPLRGRRVALLSPRIDHVIIALAAGEMAQCCIVLYRESKLPERLVELWNIAATIGSALDVQPLKSTAPVDSSSDICIPTSGTTGEPKLVRQTMSALLGRIRRDESSRARPRWLFTYHPATFGGLQVILTALSNSAALVSPSNTSISFLCDAALKHRITHVSGTPTFWRAFVSALGVQAEELRLEQITLGGEIADESVLRLLRTTFPSARIRHIYASTEAGALFSVRDGRAGFPAEWLKTGVDGVQLRICNNILQVRSPRAMLGYAASARAVMADDVWLITGDSVEQVGDRVYFRGRQDSILNVGGAKVNPEEVEHLILRMPEVSDAHVYGVANALTGVVLAADIVLQPGQQDAELRPVINSRLRSSLDAYKVPRIVKFVSALALSAGGKKQKKQ